MNVCKALHILVKKTYFLFSNSSYHESRSRAAALVLKFTNVITRLITICDTSFSLYLYSTIINKKCTIINIFKKKCKKICIYQKNFVPLYQILKVTLNRPSMKPNFEYFTYSRLCKFHKREPAAKVLKKSYINKLKSYNYEKTIYFAF